jgi:hypothetical protein
MIVEIRRYASVRRFFAEIRVNECKRNVTPTNKVLASVAWEAAFVSGERASELDITLGPPPGPRLVVLAISRQRSRASTDGCSTESDVRLWTAR